MKQDRSLAHELGELIESLLLFLERRSGIKIIKIHFDRLVYENSRKNSGIIIETEGKKIRTTEIGICGNRCPVQLNVKSGDVFLRGSRICTLGVNTLPFHYLNLLIKQYPNVSAYHDIARTMKKEGLTINRKTDDFVGAQCFCFELKRQIKSFSPVLAKCIVHGNGFAKVRAHEENYRLFTDF